MNESVCPLDRGLCSVVATPCPHIELYTIVDNSRSLWDPFLLQRGGKIPIGMTRLSVKIFAMCADVFFDVGKNQICFE